MQRYFLGATLQENFTHAQSPTTAAQLDSGFTNSARRTSAPETQIHTKSRIRLPLVNAGDNFPPLVAVQTVIKPPLLQSLGV